MARNKPPAGPSQGNSTYKRGYYPPVAGQMPRQSSLPVYHSIDTAEDEMPRQSSLPVYQSIETASHPRQQVCRTSSDNNLYRGSEWHPDHREPEAFPPGKLVLQIIKADGIKGDEVKGFGKADPYAVAKLGGEDVGITEVKTKAHMDAGSTPHWNETLTFYINKTHCDYNKLSISIRNKNTFRPDNTLAEFRKEDLGPFVTGNGKNQQLAQWYPVRLRGEERGRICLAFDFIPMSPEDILESTSVNSRDGTAHYNYSHVQPGKLVSVAAVGTVLAAVQVGVAAAAL